MIKCKVIKEFTYMPISRFQELKNIKRVGRNTLGKLYIGDTFECSNEIAEYLSGKNNSKTKVARIIEVCPDDSISKNKN